MKTRIMAGAILTHGRKVLLIHRGAHKKLAPGTWSFIGGHMEEGEMNDPEATCQREVWEEAGIGKDSIENLRLRYITAQITNGEIQVGYCYTGEVRSLGALTDCGEGELHWVDISDAPQLPMSFLTRNIMTRWLSATSDDGIYHMAISREENDVTWVKV